MKIQEFLNAAPASAADTAAKESNHVPVLPVADGEAAVSANNSHLPSNIDPEAASRIEERRLRESR